MATVSEPVERTRYLIARSSHFRTWCGVDSTLDEAGELAVALTRVHAVFALVDGLVLPFATVEYGKYTGRRVGDGGGCFTREQGVMTTFYESGDYPSDADLRLAMINFNATVKTIVDDMAALSGSSAHISFDSFTKVLETPGVLEKSARERWLYLPYRWEGEMWGSQTE